MKHRQRWLLVGLLMLALAACGGEQTATTAPVSTSGSSTTQPPAQDPPASAAVSNPLCAVATQAEVQAVIGGAITKIDVIDEADLPYVDCIYLDSQDVFNSLSIGYVTTEKLGKTNSQWPTAAAYFAEWTRNEQAVAGLGAGAAWEDTTLWVLKGDTVIKVSADKAATADAAVRAKFETLAGQVLARLP